MTAAAVVAAVGLVLWTREAPKNAAQGVPDAV
jgi:hypothetical protein